MLKRSSSITGTFQGEIQLLIPSSISKHINMFYMLHVKGKVYPSQKGEYLYSSTFSLTSALDGRVVNSTPRPL